MADIFQKCYDFVRAEEARSKGIYPYFVVIEENKGTTVVINGKEVVMAGSNNYLGLTFHPEVKEAAIKAIEKFGTGNSGSRYLNGNIILIEEFQDEISKFMNKEASLVFTTGFLTGQGAIVPLVGKDEYIISDKDNHASIVTGALIAKSLGAEMVRYANNNMDDLERVLKNLPIDAPKLIITDGVFSMTGYIVNLPRMVELAKKYNARILVDDAHGFGVLGEGGRGTASYYGLQDETDLIMFTFSKSLASLGGAVVGDYKVIDYIKHFSTALIFSASISPANIAAAIAALRVLKREPERPKRLLEIGKKMRKELSDLGYKIIDGITPIVPVIIGDDELTFKLWKELLEEGVYTNPVISPAVPRGMQLIRTTYMAIHEDKHLDRVIEAFKKAGRKLGII